MDTNNSPEEKGILEEQLEDMAKQLRSQGYPDQSLAGSELQRMLGAYNVVVEELRLLEEKPRFDPIERLPEEVSVTVLKHAAIRESHGASFISSDMMLLLTLVSSKWRRLIESTPTLWSDIVLDDDMENLAMKVTISLFLSRNTYLTVQLVDPLRCWNEINSIVLPHTGRIRSIYLVGIGTDNPFDGLFIFAIKPLITPQLRSIDSSRNRSTVVGDEKFFGGQNEHLHRVTGIILTRYILHLPSIRSLKEFATHEDATHVLAESLPHLEKVAFLEKFHQDQEPMGISLAMKSLGWTSFIYRQGVMETLTSLLSRLPLLRDLSLRINYDDFSQLITSMRDLKVLHSLDLSCWNIPDKMFVQPATIEPLDQVRTFIFREQSGIASDVEWEKLSQIPDTFFALIPNVEHLEIKSYINSLACKMTLAVGFRRVHTLLLDLLDPQFSPLRELRFPESVRNLKIKSRWPNGSIAPGVETLQVYNLDLQNAGSQYSAVWRLNLTSFEGPWNNIQSFTALTEIFVGGDKPVTRFCLIIATYPETCPTLHALSFGRFPDLDILLIMLERRNLYSRATRARIRKLELPTRLSSSNFRTVRDLLRGRMVERQSNFEASLEGNVDMLLDRNISGCVACHKAQVFCMAPVYFYLSTIGNNLPLPPYPTTVDDIVNTWEARSLTIWSVYQLRLPCCEHERLTQITEDSLEWPLTEAETDMTTSASL